MSGGLFSAVKFFRIFLTYFVTFENPTRIRLEKIGITGKIMVNIFLMKLYRDFRSIL